MIGGQAQLPSIVTPRPGFEPGSEAPEAPRISTTLPGPAKAHCSAFHINRTRDSIIIVEPGIVFAFGILFHLRLPYPGDLQGLSTGFLITIKNKFGLQRFPDLISMPDPAGSLMTYHARADRTSGCAYPVKKFAVGRLRDTPENLVTDTC